MSSPASHLSAERKAFAINEGDDLELENKQEIPYVLVQNLGHGASAIVEKVVDTTNGKIYARKIFKNNQSRRLAQAKEALQNEVKIMRRLRSHHHIIRVHATYMVQRELAMIMTPVADSGDLATFMQLYQDMDSSNPARHGMETTLWKAFGCLASGLAFIHEQTIRHKDIKPQNILIHQGGVIYTDFGISYDFSEHGRSTTTGRPDAFTRRYCAPEVMRWDKRNSKSDAWSLGCVYMEMLDALRPDLLPEVLLQGPFYETLSHVAYVLNYMPQEPVCYDVAYSISRLLNRSAYNRSSASMIQRHLRGSSGFEELFCQSCVPDCDCDNWDAAEYAKSWIEDFWYCYVLGEDCYHQSPYET